MKKIMLCFLFYHTLIISLVYSASNLTLPKIDPDHDKNISLKEPFTKEGHNKTKIIMSEGGSLVTDASLLNLKDNVTINLLSLDEEMPKTKVKPIQPRKGVENTLDIIPIQKNISSTDNNDLSAKKVSENPHSIDKTNQLKPANTSTTSKENIKTNNVTVKATTLPVKKPLVLSYDAISRPDNSYYQAKLPAMKSSFETITHDQMPSPNKDSNKPISTIGTKDPGMITPIVITILVVPMFAVLGYMALRRGQEAWKNRHYKRMDFLLDGMYND